MERICLGCWLSTPEAETVTVPAIGPNGAMVVHFCRECAEERGLTVIESKAARRRKKCAHCRAPLRSLNRVCPECEDAWAVHQEVSEIHLMATRPFRPMEECG